MTNAAKVPCEIQNQFNPPNNLVFIRQLLKSKTIGRRCPSTTSSFSCPAIQSCSCYSNVAHVPPAAANPQGDSRQHQQHGRRLWHAGEAQVDSVERAAAGEDRRLPLAEIGEVDQAGRVAGQIPLHAGLARLPPIHADRRQVFRFHDAIAVGVARQRRWEGFRVVDVEDFTGGERGVEDPRPVDGPAPVFLRAIGVGADAGGQVRRVGRVRAPAGDRRIYPTCWPSI